jgi:hypothetical protein
VDAGAVPVLSGLQHVKHDQVNRLGGGELAGMVAPGVPALERVKVEAAPVPEHDLAVDDRPGGR